MNKEKFLRMLNTAYTQEELAIPIYTKHIESVIQWSNHSPEIKEEIRTNLETIIEDTERHKIILGNLIKIVKEEF